ncbi:F-box protein CPR1-like [Cornus florida]|uniref:F-box protein CPR1-like n=1 Tax=Cornus florida TaxID=4283 RepID=UPI00289703BA|nr:F-box protein CPR1-like [Cornus florida]XP_059647995.1 F-box protein CPR1-like [Cornus florida]XP_059647996.1 F-box protein CPR1-like [Cornus florida]XP_059647997.1 F-box protein CPR1-like [Cornus florida]XP_059647998.1 F-box protein CPR1-like [Cornus florida]XP_059647999.1 F-box protein CPR1-like [Cornus florida]
MYCPLRSTAAAAAEENKMARMSRAESNSNLCHIPEEILIQILVRLSVKSLLRFRSVCKSWYSLIIDPAFIQAHLKTSSQSTHIILSYKSELTRIDRYSIRYDDESFHQYFEPQLPSHILKQSLTMYGSCNGLVCLSNEETIRLWNPALRKLKTLPNSLIIDPNLDYLRTYLAHLAFGFLPGVNDYKVVRILCLRDDIYKPLPYKSQFLTEVYSLSTDSWKRIDVAPAYDFIGNRPAIVNGAAYWVAVKRTDEGNCCLLVRFDLGDEVFDEVMLPDGARHYSPYGPDLWDEVLPGARHFYPVLGESLCFFRYYRFALNERCDIWTKECGKLGSWTKQFTVNFHDTPYNLFGLRKSGELLQINRKKDLVSYNFETQRAKDLGIHSFLWNLSAYFYVESLIQLDGAECLFPLDSEL